MGQSAIAFYSGGKTELEGVLSFPEGAGAGAKGAAAGLAVCHSHPALGGNMGEGVVVAVCRAAAARGMVSLRFNFRGVGASGGEFTNGEREHEDAKAALDVLRHWHAVDGKRLGAVGYSLGAAALLDGWRRMKRASAVALIAPTLAALRSPRFAKDKRPKLIIAGSEDRVAPSPDIQRILDGVRHPVRFYEVPGADHSMRGYEREVGDIVTEFMGDNL